MNANHIANRHANRLRRIPRRLVELEESKLRQQARAKQAGRDADTYDVDCHIARLTSRKLELTAH